MFYFKGAVSLVGHNYSCFPSGHEFIKNYTILDPTMRLNYVFFVMGMSKKSN